MQITGTMTERNDLKIALQMILKTAVKALNGSAGVIATWDEIEHRFITTESYGLDDKALNWLHTLLEESIPDLAASKDSFDLLSELQSHHLPLPSSEKGSLLNPIIALPLRLDGKSVGLIYILRSSGAISFSNVDQPVLSAFAQQAAIAVENAKLAHLLAEEKKRVESILEGSADGIFSMDAKRQITGFNLAMERLTGYSKDEVLGKKCCTVIRLHNWEGKAMCTEQCPVIRNLDNTGSFFEQEGKIQTKDEQDIDVAMKYSIVKSPQGQLLNIIANVRDISRLREIENLRATFLSMLGHQIQTPLSIIRGYTDTLSRSDGNWTEAATQEGLQVIGEECQRLSKLMSRLLLASRIEAGAMNLSKEEVQLTSIARKVVRRFEPVNCLHTFEIAFEAEFPTVDADPELIEEVIINIVDNAIKYSPDGGKIIIAGDICNNYIEIAISDEGTGISQREIGRIFEQFYRVDCSSVHKVRGAGIGLYICKYIIEAHGGNIRVDSKLGKGTKFTISLPLYQTV